MDILTIVILAIVEGITEFLPISSTAHLIITSKLLNLKQTDFLKLFEVFIQSGAIFSVIFLYIKTLLKNKKIVLNIGFSFLPTAVVGVLLYKFIKNYLFENYYLLAFNLIFVGILFLIIEKLVEKNKITLNKNLNQMNFSTAFLIGLFQSLAVFPGVSRAGAVILIMLVLGFKRKTAVEYSFLLAVPTIISASVFDLYKNLNLLSQSQEYIIYLFFGAFLSFIFALISIKWFLKFLKKHTLIPFGIYRIVVGTIFLLKSL